MVNSGFRSDAEQAALFAAPPRPALGRAAGHLAAPLRDRARPRPARRLRLAGRERRAVRLPPALLVGGLALRLRPRARRPARRPGNAVGRADPGTAADGGAARPACPGFVPARFRERPGRGRPALERLRRPARRAADGGVELQPVRGLARPGRAGIAQFMPATAAAYGLDDPFDAEAAIDAQAHLMSDLLAQFGDRLARPRRLQRRPRPGRGLRLRPRHPRDPGLRRPDPRAARRRRRHGRGRPAAARGAAGRLRRPGGGRAELNTLRAWNR